MKNLNSKTDYTKAYNGDVSTSRASKYQDKYHQFMFKSYEYLPTYCLTYEDYFISNQEIERLWDLEGTLQQALWTIIDNNLTAYQINICQTLQLSILIGEGQEWMAEKMGTTQPSIHKALHGNQNYKGGVIKRYGGIAHKLEKLIRMNNTIYNIMKEMEDLNHEQLRLPHFRCFKKIIGTSSKYQQYILNGVNNGNL